MTNPLYSIVIPCFNESLNLSPLLKSFSKFRKNFFFEVIIVNNGSTDDSQQVLSKILPEYNFAKSLYIKKNIGYGHGILSGLSMAKGNVLAYSHGDMQSSPEDLFQGFKLMEENSLIKGKRIGRSFKENFFTQGMSLFELTLFGEWLDDINAQPNIFSREFFKSWKDAPNDFSLDLYIYLLAKRNNLKIKRFPVIAFPRKRGISSWKRGAFSEISLAKKFISRSLQLKAHLDREP